MIFLASMTLHMSFPFFWKAFPQYFFYLENILPSRLSQEGFISGRCLEPSQEANGLFLYHSYILYIHWRKQIFQIYTSRNESLTYMLMKWISHTGANGNESLIAIGYMFVCLLRRKSSTQVQAKVPEYWQTINTCELNSIFWNCNLLFK